MKKQLLLCAAALSSGFIGYAQQSTKFIVSCDSSEVYRIMSENGVGRLKYKDVPRFTLVGKDSKFYLGIGANLKFVTDYDWGHPLSDADDFTPADIPMTITPGNGGHTQMSIGQSNFYLNFVGLPGSANQIGVFIDINFLGASSKTVALHQAYLKYRGITAGYVVSTFTDAAAEPAAIDFAGPNSITFDRHPNISYTMKFGKNRLWSAALGVDLPDKASYYAGSEDLTNKMTVNRRVPDIPLYIQRSWADGKGWFRASAIFRDLYYRNLVAGRNEGEFGWGVKVSGRAPIVGGLSAVWQAVYGKGVAGYIHDLSGQGLDLVPTVGNSGKLQTVKTWGAYGTLRYDFSSKFFASATYSHVRAYTPRDVAWSDCYKFGQYVTGNFFWNINSFAQFGVEYLWGRRVNFDGRQAHDNRIMALLQLSI